jgi:hypothetical protein
MADTSAKYSDLFSLMDEEETLSNETFERLKAHNLKNNEFFNENEVRMISDNFENKLKPYYLKFYDEQGNFNQSKFNDDSKQFVNLINNMKSGFIRPTKKNMITNLANRKNKITDAMKKKTQQDDDIYYENLLKYYDYLLDSKHVNVYKFYKEKSSLLEILKQSKVKTETLSTMSQSFISILQKGVTKENGINILRLQLLKSTDVIVRYSKDYLRFILFAIFALNVIYFIFGLFVGDMKSILG